jgi:hypothetical protein
MSDDSPEYDRFTKKFFDISWRYARYYQEYENKKYEYNELKENIYREYLNNFQNCEVNLNEANRLASININKSYRVNNKYNELLEIKEYKDNAEKNYKYLYDYYICNNIKLK